MCVFWPLWTFDDGYVLFDIWWYDGDGNKKWFGSRRTYQQAHDEATRLGLL